MNATPAIETLISVYGHLAPGITDNKDSALPHAISAQSSLQGSAATSADSEGSQDGTDTKKRKSSGSGSHGSNNNGKPKEEDTKRKGTTATKKRDGGGEDKRRSSKKKKSSADDSDSSADEGEGSEEKTRFRWTDELHQYFLACVFELGLEIASPKKVFLKMMADPQFAKTILDEDTFAQMVSPDAPKKFGAHHVKSHLQRFRSNIVHPREAFIKQLSELMQEAKRRKKEDGKASKALNPEYHAYPFAADRTFPDNMINSEITQMINNTLLRPNFAQQQLPNFNGVSSPPPLFGSVGSAQAINSASAAMLFTRPRTLSSYEANEQMRAQREMRERIESQGHRQVIQVETDAQQLLDQQHNDDFDVAPIQDPDDLFDWLIGPDLHDTAGNQRQSSN